MDVETKSIIHMQTVDKREVRLQSPNMEKEAFQRCLESLMSHNLEVGEIITDASSPIRKLLGNNFEIYYYVFELNFLLAANHPTIKHSMDIWHKSKKLRKALADVCCNNECIYNPYIFEYVL